MKKYQKFIDKKNFPIGIIPVRMAASRFPGKPLKKILNMTMLEHVYCRALLFKNWKKLIVATCDKEIMDFCQKRKIPSVITSSKHKRCLDRVYEAANKIKDIKDKDIVVCVQGDEPMLIPDMIQKSIIPLKKNKKANCTVLAMSIVDKKQFQDKNTVKIVHNLEGEVLYTSRSPIPYTEKFNKNLKAKRIYGIFAFKWKFLKKFHLTPESFLEKVEACDSNRICDNYGTQYIAPYPYRNSFSVDCKKDLEKVCRYMQKDKLYNFYKK
jgi:3-deoxy-manno-octulosonate cytidylyltransferase (CMP-KDO synthetase)